MRPGNPNDVIHDFVLAKGGEGASSTEIAGEFLRAKASTPVVSEAVVTGMLGADARFTRHEDGNWIALAPAAEDALPLAETRFTVVEVLTGSAPRVEDCVLEIGCVAALGNTVAEPKCTLVRPVIMPSHEDLSLLDLESDELQEAPRAEDVLREVVKSAEGSILVSLHTEGLLWLMQRVLGSADAIGEVRDLSLRRVLRQLDPDRALGNRAEAMAALGLQASGHMRASARVRVTAELLRFALERAEAAGVTTDQALLDLQFAPGDDLDFSGYVFDRAFLSSLPRSPGVYLMKDADGQVLYVGKAKDLSARVGSYFRPMKGRDEKGETILQGVHSIEIEETGSELEGLLREDELIAEIRPPINTQLEVHERPALAGRRSRIVLVAPSVEPDAAELFLAAPTGPVVQIRVTRESAGLSERAVKSAFFSGSAPTGAQSHRDCEILWTWFAANRDQVNYVEVDHASGPKEVVRLVAEHLAEADPFGTKVIHT